MQSATEENSCDGASGVPTGSMVQVCFPNVQTSVLNSLNRQREDGQLCDLSIHVQGHVFKAHRCVLAASSPYFHDQVCLLPSDNVYLYVFVKLLNMSRIGLICQDTVTHKTTLYNCGDQKSISAHTIPHYVKTR